MCVCVCVCLCVRARALRRYGCRGAADAGLRMVGVLPWSTPKDTFDHFLATSPSQFMPGFAGASTASAVPSITKRASVLASKWHNPGSKPCVGGEGWHKALQTCCSLGRRQRQSTYHHSRGSRLGLPSLRPTWVLKIHQAAVLAHRFCFSFSGGSWQQHIKDPHGNNLHCGVQALGGAAERPAALHERCCHVCSVFTIPIPPAMSVTSRLGALALDQAFLRRGLPGSYTCGKHTCEMPRVGEKYVTRRGGGVGSTQRQEVGGAEHSKANTHTQKA